MDKITDVIAGIIPNKDGKILIAQRKGEPLPLDGKWEFPGGKIKPGETSEGCLERELWEEFGIKVRVGNFFEENVHDYGFVKIRLIAHWVEYLSGKFESRVHYGTRDVYPYEMINIDFAEADIALVERLLRGC